MKNFTQISGIVLAFTFSTAAGAEQRLVTNPEMCALSAFDAQEMGTALTESDMFEIEYLCEFAQPLVFDWTRDRVDTRIGYCSEPGVISPQVWAIGMFSLEPGIVYVWSQGSEEPAVFRLCD